MITVASLLAGCDGGGSGMETVSLRLASDRDCYGVRIDVADVATGASCSAASELVDEGCSSTVQADADGLMLSASGCFTPDGTSLFECRVSPELAQKIRDSADVRCGCGCADSCPAAMAVAVCDEHGDCVSSPTSAAAPAAAGTPATQKSVSHGAQITTVSSTTTYCGTCCDVVVDSEVHLESGSGIRELTFDAILPDDPGCDVECGFEPGLGGPTSVKDLGSGRTRACIANAAGLSAPQLLFSCHGESGSFGIELESVSALGPDLRPTAPPPLLVVKDD